MNEAASNAISLAREAAKELNHGFVGSEHILVGLIRSEGTASAVLSEYGVTEALVLPYIDTLIGGGRHRFTDSLGFTPFAKRIMELALYEAKSFKENLIATRHLLLALLREKECFASRILQLAEADTDGIKQAAMSAGKDEIVYAAPNEGFRAIKGESQASIFPCEMGLVGDNEKPDEKGSKFTRNERQKNIRGELAEQGEIRCSSMVLNYYARNLTELAEANKLDPLIGCERELGRLIQTLLRRGKNNPVLVGSPGVGKTAIVEGLAEKIVSGQVPDELKGVKLMWLDIGAMLAGTKYRGEFEERLKAVLDEVDENVVIFIDEIHTIVGAGAGEGSIDAANIMKPALARGGFRLVGATTVEEYEKYIEKDAALERRFTPIVVSEPSSAEAKKILQGLRTRYEAHHGLKITDEALEACVDMSIRCIPDRFLPDKAIDLMDEACSFVRLRMGRDGGTVEVSDVASVANELTGVPVSCLTGDNANTLLSIEQRIDERVFGQGDAISSVARTIRKAYAGLNDPNRPLSTMLFIGPHGVGKTETALAFAEELLGTDSVIKLDLSEYADVASLNTLIGSPKGYSGFETGGKLTEAIKRKPYALILLKNVDVAAEEVKHIIEIMLDSGILTDGSGKTVSVRNSIVIMTASIVTQRKKIGFWSSERKDCTAVQTEAKQLIGGELLNRVDTVVQFLRTDDEANYQICRAMLKDFTDRLHKIGMEVNFSEEFVKELLSLLDKEELEQMGAAAIAKLVSCLVEDRISEEIIGGMLKRGYGCSCIMDNGKVKIVTNLMGETDGN